MQAGQHGTSQTPMEVEEHIEVTMRDQAMSSPVLVDPHQDMASPVLVESPSKPRTPESKLNDTELAIKKGEIEVNSPIVGVKAEATKIEARVTPQKQPPTTRTPYKRLKSQERAREDQRLRKSREESFKERQIHLLAIHHEATVLLSQEEAAQQIQVDLRREQATEDMKSRQPRWKAQYLEQVARFEVEEQARREDLKKRQADFDLREKENKERALKKSEAFRMKMRPIKKTRPLGTRAVEEGK